MNKVVLATLCFGAGAALGFAVGYSIYGKKEDDEYVEPIPVEKKEAEPEKAQDDILAIKPAKLAKKDGTKGINYTKYVKDLQYKRDSEHPRDDDPDEETDYDEEELNMEDYEETYEERIERENEERNEQMEQYRNEHKGKIELMQSDEWNTDFPETDYEREDLYYFVQSDILTDEDGNQKPEAETIGVKVRQVGWMQSPDDVIYVRNHPQEKEYRIFKENCSVEDWFA